MTIKKTTVLITGANRGIGRGLAEAFLSKANHVVIAAVRDPSHTTATSLKALRQAEGSFLLVVKIDSRSPYDPFAAVTTIKNAGVSHLDIVIANAGIANRFSRLENIKAQDLHDFLDVNTIGPLLLFQAVYPLLKAAAGEQGASATGPRFVGISSNAASIGNLEQIAPYEPGGYGPSKVALNYIVRLAHFENPWLTAFVIHPGFVQTEMGNEGAKHFGYERAFVSIRDSVDGIVERVVGATRETDSGHSYSYDGLDLDF